jgi:hypothetical protein
MEAEPTPRRLRWLVVLLAIGFPIISLFIWYHWLTAIYVDAVPPGEPLRQSPYHFFPGLTKKDVVVRNVVQATGRFLGTGPYLRATLYVVENGKVTKGSQVSAGESSARIGTFFGEHLSIVLAMGDVKTPIRLFTDIGCVGETRSGGASIPVPHHVKSQFHKGLPGWVPRFRERLVYVEGEQPINATASMTVEDFAKANRGNYLVVTMQLK